MVHRIGFAAALGVFLLLAACAAQTPRRQLLAAVETGDTPTVARLLSEGADPNARYRSGWSALMIAEREGYHDIARLLREAGARDVRPAPSAAAPKEAAPASSPAEAADPTPPAAGGVAAPTVPAIAGEGGDDAAEVALLRFPGSRANLFLRYRVVALLRRAGGCAEVTPVQAKPVGPASEGDAWREVWLVKMCGTPRMFEVGFTPSPDGDVCGVKIEVR
ncbi:ankyrin repeat domain-containing protein [Dissulfurirhabdus thermomarina]|uniref:Ankyrin repeat domain-containing protein n=1 Tax=Dissulfurirhabdus thermomarina TaxID=1765737 RepID=A0A6N9TPM2_DISTH|nr:ankyrin repeat domain-containing protein [Dissulfurirhabdus thermomarina]NDY43215.1 ankyrin repeat domain-containing protein [Dissulfurirhabdus thermomarina]NMX23933.1 ankyrin repeat domain-containing protein [Dissulfurirhabdus thermomarina]